MMTGSCTAYRVGFALRDLRICRLELNHGC